MRSFLNSVLLSATLVACLASQPPLAAGAEEQTGEAPPDEHREPATSLEFPGMWIGGSLPDLESLRGKAVLLYFFEEDCPRCGAAWPNIVATAKKYESQPILFVAVNSGSPPARVEQYANKNGVPWPIIVDVDRTFELTCGVNPISLRNVMQLKTISPEGLLQPGDFRDLEGTIERALKGAHWNLDPQDIPAELHEVWLAVELGRYADAAKLLKADRSLRRANLQEANRKLTDYVNDRLGKELAGAKSDPDKLSSYEHYTKIAEQFAGFPGAIDAMKASRDLARDPAVKSELASLKQFERQRQLYNSANPSQQNKATAALKKLISDQPGSAGAKRAQELLRGT
jgi:peroxiredoxin